jgi:ADP-ribosylglycohydrolase
VLAGAVGDALGFTVEFDSIDAIRRRYGTAGITDFDRSFGRDGRISDDTQMTLFTLEGLIRAHVRRRLTGDDDVLLAVQHAYQRWLHTQGIPWPTAAGMFGAHAPTPDGWLISNPGLFEKRAPGHTCVTALRIFAQTGRPGTFVHRLNDSKGCGGVMRAAPAALYSEDPDEVFHLGAAVAALTHSHPSGYLSAGALAVIVHQIIGGAGLPAALGTARSILVRWDGHDEQARALDAAVEVAEAGPPTPERIAERLGGGWVGEEALAIGVCAALCTDNLADALIVAVNHSGDSDSTGAVCGNIVGAYYGAPAIPQPWLDDLEVRDVIDTLAGDALEEFSSQPRTDTGWYQRYPGW